MGEIAPTAEDRETSFRIARFFLGNDDSLPDQLRSGELDRHFLLDEIAAHRLTALEEAAKVAERYPLRSDHSKHNMMLGIAAAIRALSQPKVEWPTGMIDAEMEAFASQSRETGG